MSWDFDSQLVRDSGNGQFNLALGEPEKLRQMVDLEIGEEIRHFRGEFNYPNNKPEHELMTQLEECHPDSHVVVTNGAKQAILAALYARPGGQTIVSSRTPCWPSYASIAALSGMQFKPLTKDLKNDGSTCIINASPNNPDGSIDTEPSKNTYIWDAAYASPIYGFDRYDDQNNQFFENVPVSVYSAAKLFGLSGIRVGWLVTKDKQIAQKAAQYVEMTTSGVPTICQSIAAKCIELIPALFKDQRLYRTSYIWGTISDAFEKNRQTLIAAMEPGIESVSTAQNGMFLWFKAKDRAGFSSKLSQAGVAMVSGEACHYSGGYFRANLGRTLWYTEEAAKKLKAVFF